MKIIQVLNLPPLDNARPRPFPAGGYPLQVTWQPRRNNECDTKYDK